MFARAFIVATRKCAPELAHPTPPPTAPRLINLRPSQFILPSTFESLSLPYPSVRQNRHANTPTGRYTTRAPKPRPHLQSSYGGHALNQSADISRSLAKPKHNDACLQ